MLALVAAPSSPSIVELREVPEPTPRPHEALVEVRAVSLNRGEVNRATAAEDGWRPGWDVSGVVLRAAEDGRGPRQGARVVGLLPVGGWCERVAVPVTELAEIPDGLSFAAASTLPVAGLTALRALAIGGRLLGQRVLVTGAAGGAARDGRAGADDGRFDLIVESIGGEALGRAMRLVARGGTVVTLGNSAKEPTQFDTREFFSIGGARLYGFHLVVHEMVVEPVAADLGYLARLVADGRLVAKISLEADWREAGPVLHALLDRRVDGKAVLHVGG
jgi:NADPH:quinone reductase